MSDGEEKKSHNPFHRNKEDKEPKEPRTPEEELKHHKKLENLGKAAVVGAGAYAMYEKHKAKKDPENAHRHNVSEEIAAVAAVGAGGFAFHEHHKKKDAKKELKDSH